MLKIRFYLRLFKTFLARFKVIIFFASTLGALIFILLQLWFTQNYGLTNERIGIIGKYSSDNLPDQILELIGNGLTKIENDGRPSPDLAKSWSTSDKGKSWIFVLDSSKKWSDGSAITPESIKYNFSDVKQKVDNNTVTYFLNDPLATFPVILSKPTFKKGLIGAGQWKVKTIQRTGNNITSLVLEKSGNLKTFKFYPTEESVKLAYKLGEIDFIDDIIDPSPFDKWNNTVIEKYTNYQRLLVIFLNTADSQLADKSIRQALNYAIDKEAVSYVRAISPISSLSWAYNPQVKIYSYDIPRAKELLGKTELKIKLATFPGLLPIAENIAHYWKEAGIETTVQVSTVKPDDFQAFLAIYDIPLDPDQYNFWHSTQKDTNITGFSNPRIDKLLEDGRAETDHATRKRFYLDFQRYLVEETPAIFLYYPQYFKISRK